MPVDLAGGGRRLGNGPNRDSEGDTTMTEYLILLYERESGYAEGGQEAWQAAGEAHARFQGQVAEKGGKILGGNALQPTATATSIRDDVVTDGPFTETKEALGGYYLIEARDLDPALALPRRSPAPHAGVEGRPDRDRSGAVERGGGGGALGGKLALLIEPDGQAGPAGLPPAGPDAGGDVIADDRLRLVFTCCHPALAREAQVALTLRLLCGLTTAEIAQAFLVSEPTMAARVTRAKKKISAARIPYRVPGAAELPDRLHALLPVGHLLYTTGHTAPGGADVVRPDLVDRALGLARLLRDLMPDEREVGGLLALLLLTGGGRAARTAADGRLLLLEEQDRSQWDRAAISEGAGLVAEMMRSSERPGQFALQAAIAAVHAQAPSYGGTDWPQLLRLYDGLLRAWPTPVVALNRAVVLAMVDGAEAALAEIEAVERDGRLAGYRYLPAAKADLLRRIGRMV